MDTSASCFPPCSLHRAKEALHSLPFFYSAHGGCTFTLPTFISQQRGMQATAPQVTQEYFCKVTTQKPTASPGRSIPPHRTHDDPARSSSGGAGNTLRHQQRRRSTSGFPGSTLYPQGPRRAGLVTTAQFTESWVLEGAHLVFHPVPGPGRGAPGGTRGSAGGAGALGGSQG